MHGDVSNQWCRTYYSSKKHYVTIKPFGSSLCKVKKLKIQKLLQDRSNLGKQRDTFKNKFQKKSTYIHNL